MATGTPAKRTSLFRHGFSAGIMLVISFTELLPDATAEAGAITAILTAVAGSLVLFSLYLVIPHTHLVDEREGLGSQALKSAYLVVFGLILRDFPEGFAMTRLYGNQLWFAAGLFLSVFVYLMLSVIIW